MGLNQILKGSAANVFSSKIFRIFTYLIDISVTFVCRVLFLFMFLSYECFLKIKCILENVYWRVQDYRCVPSSKDISNIRSYLIEQKRTFKKTPNHIVLILGPEKASHEDLAKMISWCEPIGIKYISFYDHKNGIDPLSVFEAVRRYNRNIIHKIKWGKFFTDDIKKASVKEINGYRWEGVVRVNILRQEEGNRGLLDVARELYNRSRGADGSAGTAGSVDQATLSRHMDERLDTPPPDLALVCGNHLSYFACTPWHLRLTQFVRMQSHREIGVSKFLNTLHQYSHSEQRFGK